VSIILGFQFTRKFQSSLFFSRGNVWDNGTQSAEAFQIHPLHWFLARVAGENCAGGMPFQVTQLLRNGFSPITQEQSSN
jgi:hypothetical protein